MTRDEERQAIALRWREIDSELEKLEARKGELSPRSYRAERNELLAQHDKLEYRLGELYLADTSRGPVTLVRSPYVRE